MAAAEPILELQQYFSAAAFTIFFSHEFIQETPRFFEWLAGILLTCWFVMQLFRIMERAAHGERTAPADIFFPALRAYGLLLFCRPAILYLNEVFWFMIDAITVEAPELVLNLRINALTQQLTTPYAFFVVILLCVITVMTHVPHHEALCHDLRPDRAGVFLLL